MGLKVVMLTEVHLEDSVSPRTLAGQRLCYGDKKKRTAVLTRSHWKKKVLAQLGWSHIVRIWE